MPDDLPIQGPLGIWPFPVLNALVMAANQEGEGFNVKEYNVVRDNNGRIESVQIVEGMGDE